MKLSDGNKLNTNDLMEQHAYQFTTKVGTTIFPVKGIVKSISVLRTENTEQLVVVSESLKGSQADPVSRTFLTFLAGTEPKHLIKYWRFIGGLNVVNKVRLNVYLKGEENG